MPENMSPRPTNAAKAKKPELMNTPPATLTATMAPAVILRHRPLLIENLSCLFVPWCYPYRSYVLIILELTKLAITNIVG